VKHFLSPQPLTTPKKRKETNISAQSQAAEQMSLCGHWFFQSASHGRDLFDTCKLWAFELLVFNGKIDLLIAPTPNV